MTHPSYNQSSNNSREISMEEEQDPSLHAKLHSEISSMDTLHSKKSSPKPFKKILEQTNSLPILSYIPSASKKWKNYIPMLKNGLSLPLSLPH